MPGFQRLSDAVIAFVDYLSIVEVDGMITLFNISDMFFSPF